MNPHDDFESEESFRYAAECRRLARLGRKARTVATPDAGTAAALRSWMDWFGSVVAQYGGPLHRPQFAASRSSRR